MNIVITANIYLPKPQLVLGIPSHTVTHSEIRAIQITIMSIIINELLVTKNAQFHDVDMLLNTIYIECIKIVICNKSISQKEMQNLLHQVEIVLLLHSVTRKNRQMPIKVAQI